MRALTNIGELVTNDPRIGEGPLGLLYDAAIVFDDRVRWVGASSQVPAGALVIDAEGAAVLPGFVDSHAHLVFAGDRGPEFTARMAGIAYGAGGIRTTVSATRAASDEHLRANLRRLSREMLLGGITTFECKSGYGLTVDDEIRSLRIAREFTDEVTLLAAHVTPPEFVENPDEYVRLIIDLLLPAARGMARWFDVFCEQGAFTEEQTIRLLTAARDHGFELRLHANQLTASGAADIAVAFDCASADHASHLSVAQVLALAASNTVVTLLPGAEFSTRSRYPDARVLLDAGARVALATDCNPGSSFTTSMLFCIAIAVRDMHFSPSEAVWSATAGGAAALRRSDIGHLGIGARADVIKLTAPSYVHCAYRPGVPLVADVWRAGQHLIQEGMHHA